MIPGCGAVRRVPEKPPEARAPEAGRQERAPTPAIAGCAGVATLPVKLPELDAIPERERPPAVAVRRSEADRYWVLLWRVWASPPRPASGEGNVPATRCETGGHSDAVNREVRERPASQIQTESAGHDRVGGSWGA